MHLFIIHLCLKLSDVLELMVAVFSHHFVCCPEFLNSLDQQLSQECHSSFKWKKCCGFPAALVLCVCVWCACFLLSLTVTLHSFSFWYDSCLSRGITLLQVIWLSWIDATRTEQKHDIWQLFFFLLRGTVAFAIVLCVYVHSIHALLRNIKHWRLVITFVNMLSNWDHITFLL